MKHGCAERGDIVLIDLNPTQGREQQGQRPVLVVSPLEFNRVCGVAWVCPITQGGEGLRQRGFTVSLMGCGTQTQGVVLCHQPRALDLRARQAVFKEKAPPELVDEVLARLRAVLD
ncbi:MAG: type II toxin-antitoxin system PemK/MazF family toxin [Rhodocyclaceae bacterium]|nr:type II toxin-antitoxin system PemK/MazF family toxin [Rhodocyclaceae bacterium]